MSTATEKIRVLFLCTGNSCRSQMAEVWARALKSELLEAYSAGVEVHGLNPHAVRVMAEESSRKVRTPNNESIVIMEQFR